MDVLFLVALVCWAPVYLWFFMMVFMTCVNYVLFNFNFHHYEVRTTLTMCFFFFFRFAGHLKCSSFIHDDLSTAAVS